MSVVCIQEQVPQQLTSVSRNKFHKNYRLYSGTNFTTITAGSPPCDFRLNDASKQLSRVAETCADVSGTLDFSRKEIASLATGVFDGLPLVT